MQSVLCQAQYLDWNMTLHFHFELGDTTTSNSPQKNCCGVPFFSNHVSDFERCFYVLLLLQVTIGKRAWSLLAIFIFLFLKESCWLWKKAQSLPWWPGCFVWRWCYRRLGLQALLLKFSKHITTHCGIYKPLLQIIFVILSLRFFPLILYHYSWSTY